MTKHTLDDGATLLGLPPRPPHFTWGGIFYLQLLIITPPPLIQANLASLVVFIDYISSSNVLFS